MGLLNKARELTGEPSRHLLKKGVAASARVTRAKETGLYTGVAKDPVVKFTLQVSLPDGDDYEVQHRQWVPRLALARAQPGCVLAVRVDPKDRASIAIDWSAAPPEQSFEPTAPARKFDFTGAAPEPEGPRLAPGADVVEAKFGMKLAFDGAYLAVTKPGEDPVLAPLPAVRSIELSEGDQGMGTAGYLFVMVSAAGVRLPPVAFPPAGRQAAETFLDKVRRAREDVDPAAAAEAGGSG
jgi:hypothetical protein